ncbi:MAG: glycoside hydrolase [Clostridia bacterium]|nr:glycoside hydrolase [Clostridia bacterium]
MILTTVAYKNGAPLVTKADVPVLEEAALIGEKEWEVVGLYPEFEYQTFRGCGTALTESACYLLDRLAPEERESLLRLWFGEGGVDARFIRCHLDSCDYSLTEYQAVADVLSDPEFETFTIERDLRSVIPTVLEAVRMSGGKARVMLSPWSPPAEWKTPPTQIADGRLPENEPPSRNRGGKLKPEFYASWAKYIAKYVKAWLDAGVPVTMLTPQNETIAANDWDSCVWTAGEMKIFVRDHLAPALRAAGVDGRVGLYAWDHNKEHMLEHLDALIDGETAPLFDGVAYHWYTGDHFEALGLTAGKYPQFTLIHSESCPLHPPTHGVELDDALAYAHDMLGDLNHGMEGWIDWNITVDRRGGPRHTPGGFSAPVVCEDRGGYTKQLAYEFIKLFSEIVVPGSVRIASSAYGQGIEAAAVRRPDGALGVLLLNLSDRPSALSVRAEGRVAELTVPAKGMAGCVI